MWERLGSQGAVLAAELIILTNQGATPGVRELAAAFERASGHKVTVIQEEGAALEQRLSNGPADLITGNPGPMEELVKNGKVVASTVTPFVLAGLGLSVRAGAPKPDISTVEAYKATLLAAKSIGYSRGCSGTNIGEGIAQLGLTEQLKAKTTFTTGGPVTDYLARGDFEIGIQQTNIMVGVPGTDYVGPLPGSLNKPCPSSVACVDGLEGAGRRARDDQVHDFAGGRAAAPQDPRGTGQALKTGVREICHGPVRPWWDLEQTAKRMPGRLSSGQPFVRRRRVPWKRGLSPNSRAGHPGWLRCSSLTYAEYARSSRLAIRAPRSGT